jgi:hypothetical protein
MKLTYRGVPYEQPSLELATLETGKTVQYRGCVYPLRHAPTGVALHHTSGITYRGAGTRCFKGLFLGRSYYRCAVEFTPIAAEA